MQDPPGIEATSSKCARSCSCGLCRLELLPVDLAEAVRWMATETPLPDDELLSSDVLFKSCICLLRKDDFRRVRLAHRTVREYLQSTRIGHGPARYSFLPEHLAVELCLVTAVNRLLSQKFLDSDTGKCFRVFTRFASDLPTWISEGESADIAAANDSLCGKVFRLFDSQDGNIARISSVLRRRTLDRSVEWKTAIWHYVPVLRCEPRVQSQRSLELVVRLCVANAWPVFKKYIERHDPAEQSRLLGAKASHPTFGDCTLVEIGAIQGRLDMVDYLLSQGPRLQDDNKIVMHLSHRLAAEGSFPTDELPRLIKQAVHHGASVNPHNTFMTPLQVAVSETNNRVVAWLLDAGANPDAVADKPFEFSDVHPGDWTWPLSLINASSRGRFPEFKIFGCRKPLDICRCIRYKLASGAIQPVYESSGAPKRTGRVWNCELLLHPGAAEEIERLLLRYGATASETGSAYDSWPLSREAWESSCQCDVVQISPAANLGGRNPASVYMTQRFGH